ncbi:hypothetical protein [Sulfobacillus thermosulfidooxidans]|uniref:hypothetical protein n=1 Tax=Sulfobacillus thermosulfidooxidans TaxID=28034 RepID=UPI0006B45D94|nr:hypothetical protein [Sulfobacillus thermosulfidooxidans]
MVCRQPLPRVPAAAGTIGSALGLVLILMGVTGGIAVSRLWHVQQTLDRAAHAAAVSEAQNGCWTAQTSQIVRQILQGGGLPVTGSHAVQVIRYTDTQDMTQPYGQLVTAKISWAVPISIVHLQLPTTVPLSSTVDQPSQYVAANSNTTQTNSQCTAPDLSTANASATPTCTPTTIYVTQDIPAKTSCQPQTSSVCSPSTHNVWVSSTSEQCGYTTHNEWTCHPQTSCHTVTTESCTTQRSFNPYLNCHAVWNPWIDGWGRQCEGGWSYSTSCTPTTRDVCSTTSTCGWSPVSSYSCHPVTSGHWVTETTESCHDVTTTHCTTIPAHTEKIPETVQQCS